MNASEFERALAAHSPERVHQAIRVAGGAALGPSRLTKGPPGVKVEGSDGRRMVTVRVSEQSATDPSTFAEQTYNVREGKAQAVFEWLGSG